MLPVTLPYSRCCPFAAQLQGRRSTRHALQRHDARIDQNFAHIFEIHRHPAAHHGLYLPLAPIRLLRMAHALSRLQPGMESVGVALIVHAAFSIGGIDFKYEHADRTDDNARATNNEPFFG